MILESIVQKQEVKIESGQELGYRNFHDLGRG
jgi:hypothetical protein